MYNKRKNRFRNKSLKKRRKRKPYNAKQVSDIIHKATIRSGPIIHHDTAVFSSTAITSSGHIVCLSNIAQGVTEHTRRGEETRLLSARIRWRCKKSVNQVEAYYRMIVFRVMNDDTPTLASADTGVLESTGGSLALLRQDTKNINIIFSDKARAHNTIDDYHYGEMYFDLKNVKASYDGAADTDKTKGHVYVLLVSNETGDDSPLMTMYSRVYLRSM